MPEESRSRDSWLFLAGSYARPGRSDEAAKAKAKLLDRFPNVSAERMLNEDHAFARRQEEDFFVETFRLLDLPVCLRPEEAKMPNLKARAECEAERARVTATRS